MITIYAEKPDVARKIAAAIGPIVLPSGKTVEYKDLSTYEKQIKGAYSKQGFIPIVWKGEKTAVTWGYGHLCGLSDLVEYDEHYKQWRNIELPFIPDNYKIRAKKETYSQFKVVKDLFNSSDLIVNATDWDREGELIFAYAYQVARCKKPFKRAYYVSQNKEAFNEAFDNLKDSKDVMNSEAAGRCRSIADWLVGINLTVATTLSSRADSVASIGRVQTPTLAMVVDRELKIRNFKSTKYYVPQAKFKTSKGEEYTGTYVVKGKITNKEDAEKIVSSLTGNAVVKSIEKKMKTVKVPSLYSLSILQMEANSRFGMTANETLETVQSLYEMGVVTYPRTNSAYLPEDYRPQATAALKALAKTDKYGKYIKDGSIKFDSRFFDDSKIESHFAIVPTHVTPTKALTANQEKVYDLIAKSLIMATYPAAKVEDTTVITEDNGEKFSTKGSVVVSKGWMEVSSPSKETLLPALSEGERVSGHYELAEKETEPPKRYTDKTLIAAMVAADKDADDTDIMSLAELNIAGIGTEATRAAIIETLVKRGYIERNKKSIAATDKGIALIEKFPVNDLKSATMTAEWETRLSRIAAGKEKSDLFIKDIEKATEKWVKEINKDMTSLAGVKSSGADTGIKCPVCGKAVVKNKWGWGCSGYKEGCKFTVSQTIAGKKLTDTQFKALMTKGETPIIKGFTSKSGKKFNAKLKLNDSNKVEFKFE